MSFVEIESACQGHVNLEVTLRTFLLSLKRLQRDPSSTERIESVKNQIKAVETFVSQQMIFIGTSSSPVILQARFNVQSLAGEAQKLSDAVKLKLADQKSTSNYDLETEIGQIEELIKRVQSNLPEPSQGNIEVHSQNDRYFKHWPTS